MPTEISEGEKYIMKSKISNHKSNDLPKNLGGVWYMHLKICVLLFKKMWIYVGEKCVKIRIILFKN